MLPFPHRNHCREPSDCRRRVALPGSLIAIVLAFAPSAARAVPGFARQMNLQCTVCHTEFPILTEFGRAFKLSGYSRSTGETDHLPDRLHAAAVLYPTQIAQPGGTAYSTAAVSARGENHEPQSLADRVHVALPLIGTRQSADVTFDAPATPGVYPFLCSFPAHCQIGMRQELIVK
jgi:hypothetical protein